MVHPLSGGRGSAGKRSGSGFDVQLCVAGGADSGGSPAATDARDGGRSPEAAVEPVRAAVRGLWETLDSAGALAAGLVAPGSLLDSERAAADRAAGVQPAVSVVRGPGDR